MKVFFGRMSLFFRIRMKVYLAFRGAAGPRFDEAELVTMVGSSGPSFTDDCLRDCRETILLQKTADLYWTCSLLEVAGAKHQKCRRLQMSAARCAPVHVAMAWLSTFSKVGTNSWHTRVTGPSCLKFGRGRQGCRCAFEGHRDGRN